MDEEKHELEDLFANYGIGGEDVSGMLPDYVNFKASKLVSAWAFSEMVRAFKPIEEKLKVMRDNGQLTPTQYGALEQWFLD